VLSSIPQGGLVPFWCESTHRFAFPGACRNRRFPPASCHLPQKLIRPIAAGTSGQLKFSLEDTGIVSGARFKVYFLQDPPEDVVIAALVERRYSPADAAKIVSACGTRLRVLEEPLSLSPPRDVDVFIIEQEEAAIGQFVSVLKSLSRADAKSAAGLLDAIATAEERGTAPPSLALIPEAVMAADFTRVIFIASTGDLAFQSRIHSRVWRRHREALTTGWGVSAARRVP
jgi:hypothetical protein